MSTATDKKADSHREKMAVRSRRKSELTRDIGQLPAIKNPQRRRLATADLRTFYETYFPDIFKLKWSPDHLRAIDTIEHCINTGGLFAFAMPRGGGKTSLALAAAIFALFTGKRKYVFLIAATAKLAAKLLRSIKKQIAENQLLLEDFPEICYPFHKLGGMAQRAGGQLYQGKPTGIGFKEHQIILPMIAESTAADTVVETRGITGAIRGAHYATAGGEILRPDLCVVDDPQTRESSGSASQCQTRLQILHGDVLGLAGPGEKIALIMPLTVINPGDLADVILTPDLYPEWESHRTRLLTTMPDDLAFWDDYNAVRMKEIQARGNGSKANRFYRRHRKALDAGAKASWPERKVAGDVSAIQHAMHLYFRNRETFWGEFQNDPSHAEMTESLALTAELVNQKRNGLRRYQIPEAAEWLTAYCDVQETLLYYAVTAWEQNGSGYIVDYGSYPEQATAYFTLTGARKRLADVHPTAGIEGAIFAGAKALLNRLRTTAYVRQDGAVMQPTIILFDTKYKPDTLHSMLSQHGRPNVDMPATGVGIGAAKKPFSEYRPEGGLLGPGWRIPKVTGGRVLRVLNIDTNFYKSRLRDGLLLAQGDSGAITIFGKDKTGRQLTPSAHRMLADHCCAEHFVTMKNIATGRVLDEWRENPSKPDNHLWDCLVGATAAGSVLGANPITVATNTKPKKRRTGRGGRKPRQKISYL